MSNDSSYGVAPLIKENASLQLRGTELNSQNLWVVLELGISNKETYTSFSSSFGDMSKKTDSLLWRNIFQEKSSHGSTFTSRGFEIPKIGGPWKAICSTVLKHA